MTWSARACSILVLLCIVPAGLRAETPEPVADLLDRLAAEAAGFKTLKTAFVQEKRLAVFENTVVLEGRIFLKKPDLLAWHVDKPVKYSVVISGKSVRQWDEDTKRTQEISLEKNPALQSALQLTVWFSGSYGALLKDYEVEVLRTSPYAFAFTPKETNVAAKVVKQVQIEFRKDHKYIRKITIIEQSGDSSEITFSDTLFDVPLDAHDFEVERRV